MNKELPETLAIIAGNGAYPRLLAESARTQGIKRLIAIAFRRETDRAIESQVDETRWVTLGRLGELIDAVVDSGARHAVMAGQISPTHLFRIRLDAAMLDLLRKLPERNAHSIFGAVCLQLKARGIDLLPASSCMEAHMPRAGLLSSRAPTPDEQRDIQIGIDVARATSRLDIGQTVVVKQGTILAVEAFEGTDESIIRAGRLGGKGGTVVKLAKPGHDMRFDIPVIGARTLRTLRKARAAVLAVEAGRTILLERETLIAMANDQDLALVVIPEAPHDR